ncbi:MAG: hypothetical protein AAF609_01435 [Cyanobacteria bacterium P01_C01_bin.120]
MKHKISFVATIVVSAILAILFASITFFAVAQEEGLGYSEGPFPLIDNPEVAIGATPLAAVQAAARDVDTIEENAFFSTVLGGEEYGFIVVTADYIANSAVLLKDGEDWQFVCREASLIPEYRLIENCGVPEAIASQLYEGVVQVLEQAQ